MNAPVSSSASGARVVAANLLSAAPLAGLVAAIVNAGLFFISTSLGLFPNTALVNGQPLTVVPVLISSVLPTLLAGGVYALIGRFSRHPWRVFRTLAMILLVLSFANPFMGIPGVTVPMAFVLNVMHVVVAASVLYFFRTRATVGTAD